MRVRHQLSHRRRNAKQRFAKAPKLYWPFDKDDDMYLSFTPEQEMLRQSLERFVADKVRAPAKLWDEQERFCREAIAPLSEMGMLGITTPSAFGGAGLGYTELALVVETLAAADGSLALTVASHIGLCSGHIALAGSEEQKARYLPALSAGEHMGAWALTEPDSGSDAVAMQTTATAEPGGWRLRGSKIFITQGTVAEVYVVLAVTDRSRGSRGVTAFVVHKGAAGFGQQPLKGKHGMRGSDTAVLSFDDVFVPDAQVLGAVGGGFIDTLKILDRGRITIAALALGLGRGALQAARTYAQQRRQFKQPLASFQGIQWKLADMATELQAAELLVYQAAGLCDAHKPFGTAASMAKLYASEAAMRACSEAVQIHGGYGYTSDFVVERHLRDAKLCTIGEGTSEIQRLLIARHVLKDS